MNACAIARSARLTGLWTGRGKRRSRATCADERYGTDRRHQDVSAMSPPKGEQREASHYWWGPLRTRPSTPAPAWWPPTGCRSARPLAVAPPAKLAALGLGEGLAVDEGGAARVRWHAAGRCTLEQATGAKRIGPGRGGWLTPCVGREQGRWLRGRSCGLLERGGRALARSARAGLGGAFVAAGAREGAIDLTRTEGGSG